MYWADNFWPKNIIIKLNHSRGIGVLYRNLLSLYDYKVNYLLFWGVGHNLLTGLGFTVFQSVPYSYFGEIFCVASVCVGSMPPVIITFQFLFVSLVYMAGQTIHV